MTDEEIIDIFIIKDKNKIDSNKIRKITQEQSEYLKNRYEDFVTYSNTIWRIKNHIDECPRCLTCGKKLPLLDGKHNPRKFCCVRCSSLNPLTQEKNKKTCLEKYGVEWSFQSENNKEKSKQTCMKHYGVDNVMKLKSFHENARKICLEKYGDENYNNPLQGKKTKLERYGSENYNNIEKREQTCLEKYGVVNTFQSKELMQKYYDRNIERYGVPYYVVTDSFKEKSKNTCLEKYGVEFWSKTDEHKQTLSQIMTCKEIRDKVKKTNNERYGADNWSQSKIGKERLSYILSSDEVQQKMINTKKQNGTFNTSKPENECYELLKTKFNNITPQKRDDSKYPFHCDFYIGDIDTWVEYQGSWTHGFHPYDPNNEDDINLLKSINEKDLIKHPYYQSFIDTWTVRDPKKRNIAKQNHLNYIEFWDLDEVKKWLENYDNKE